MMHAQGLGGKKSIKAAVGAFESSQEKSASQRQRDQRISEVAAHVSLKGIGYDMDNAISERNLRRDRKAKHLAKHVEDAIFRSCKAEGCGYMETKDGKRFKTCYGCLSVCYCSKNCQTKDWKARHKHTCGKDEDKRWIKLIYP